MRRRALVALMLAAGAAQAAPLCRDSKGLFTPCPAMVGDRHAAAVRQARAAHAPEAVSTAAMVGKPARPAHPARPSAFQTGKLCRDSKGLFKPC